MSRTLLFVGGPWHTQLRTVGGPGPFVVEYLDQEIVPVANPDLSEEARIGRGLYQVCQFAMSDPTTTMDERALVLRRKDLPWDIRWRRYDENPERRWVRVAVWSELLPDGITPGPEADQLLQQAATWRFLGEVGATVQPPPWGRMTTTTTP